MATTDLQSENDRLKQELEKMTARLREMELRESKNEAAVVMPTRARAPSGPRLAVPGHGGRKHGPVKVALEEVYDTDGNEVGLVVHRVTGQRRTAGGGYESVSASESESDGSSSGRDSSQRKHRKTKRKHWKKARHAFAKASATEPSPPSAKPRRARGHRVQMHVSSLAQDVAVTLNCHSVTESLVVQRSAEVLGILQRCLPTIPVTAVRSDENLDSILQKEAASSRSAFYLMDLSVAVMKYLHWRAVFPRVRPHYAVKSNPDPLLCRTLFALGAGFDCASSAELDLVHAMGARDDDIIFANPVKQETHIEHARSLAVRRMTFDNLAEIDKIVRCYPSAELVLRILPDDTHSLSPFGSKFGARKEDVPALLDHCKATGAKLIGVSFHVGSGCQDPHAYADAVLLAYEVFQEAESRGMHLTLLDIGGGWPGHEDTASEITLESVGDLVRPIFATYFPADVRIIAEPGRYFCTECVTLAVNVVGRRERVSSYLQDTYREMSGESPAPAQLAHVEPAKEMLYYLSDGLYGSFTNIYWDHYTPDAKVLPRSPSPAQTPAASTTPRLRSQLFGPTCDSIDIIAKDIELPELQIGDWLYFSRMGAYTSSAGTQFNGFTRPSTRYIIRNQ